MDRKAKGTRAELELLHKFWGTGKWVVLRAPASGAIKYPCPDLLAGNRLRKLAIECKSTSDNKQYLESQEINSLKEFSAIFGAEPWVAVRFAKTREEKDSWFFISTEDLEQTTGGNFVVTIETAKRKGLLFDEMTKVE